MLDRNGRSLVFVKRRVATSLHKTFASSVQNGRFFVQSKTLCSRTCNERTKLCVIATMNATLILMCVTSMCKEMLMQNFLFRCNHLCSTTKTMTVMLNGKFVANYCNRCHMKFMSMQ